LERPFLAVFFVGTFFFNGLIKSFIKRAQGWLMKQNEVKRVKMKMFWGAEIKTIK
jgi:hypothetical protein